MDFDHTVVDENSISFLNSSMPQGQVPQSTKEMFLQTFSFIPYQRIFYKKVHELKITKQMILKLIGDIPAITDMDKLISLLHNHNFDIIIISNSNSIFVENWLHFKSLKHVIKKVFTNPAWFDNTGLINVNGLQNQSCCRMSPSNLCKKLVMKRFLKIQKENNINYEKIIYIGDGKNDLCAVQSLGTNDLVFARAGYLLYDRIMRNQDRVQAKVFTWSKGNDIIEVLKNKIGMR